VQPDHVLFIASAIGIGLVLEVMIDGTVSLLREFVSLVRGML
jgi:hypothetical protein